MDARRVALIGNADYTGLEKSYKALTESPAEIADVAAVYAPDGVVDRPRQGVDATQAAFWAARGGGDRPRRGRCTTAGTAAWTRRSHSRPASC